MVQFSYTDPMQNPLNATHIDVKPFAKAQTRLAGTVPLREFARLSEDCVGDATGDVVWAAQGMMQPDSAGTDAAWLHLTATAQVTLICQRCLTTVDLALQVQRDFRFVPDEATALAQDDESEEDLLVLSREFDVLALVEDELLMAMPIVPMHEFCESKYLQTFGAPADLPSEPPPHPFAALAALKVRKD
jgi:uncharacterized protein